MWLYVQISALLATGAIVYILASRIYAKLSKKFKERAPIIKKYWIFVIPLLLITAIAYVLVGVFFYSEVSFSLVGQISGLVLAVFAGYIAFSELGENRFDKLKDIGMAHFTRKEFRAAQVNWEEAHAIKANDSNLLGNLLEVYLILGLYEKFDSKIMQYKKMLLEDSDSLAYLYLMTLRYLFQERIGDAKVHIEKSVKFVNENPGIRDRFYWKNTELVQSDAFKSLSGNTKKIVRNHFSYLTHSLETQDEIKFTAGDYDLTS